MTASRGGSARLGEPAPAGWGRNAADLTNRECARRQFARDVGCFDELLARPLGVLSSELRPRGAVVPGGLRGKNLASGRRDTIETGELFQRSVDLE